MPREDAFAGQIERKLYDGFEAPEAASKRATPGPRRAHPGAARKPQGTGRPASLSVTDAKGTPAA